MTDTTSKAPERLKERPRSRQDPQSRESSATDSSLVKNPTKRRRLMTNNNKPRPFRRAVDSLVPYKTLPPPTDAYIQLRFRVLNCDTPEIVHRVVRIPLSYTFANLYYLMLFLFGWTGNHVHEASVYSHVETYKGGANNNANTGVMKKYGRTPPVPDWCTDSRMWEREEGSSALYQVVRQGESRWSHHEWYNAEWVPRVEDADCTIGQVWNENPAHNASRGKCANDAIGVLYEYNMALGAGWVVHITCDHDKSPFVISEPASNQPIVVEAEGGAVFSDTSDNFDQFCKEHVAV